MSQQRFVDYFSRFSYSFLTLFNSEINVAKRFMVLEFHAIGFCSSSTFNERVVF